MLLRYPPAADTIAPAKKGGINSVTHACAMLRQGMPGGGQDGDFF